MEQVADSLVIIHKGKKIAEGAMDDLLNPDQTKIEIETTSAAALEQQLRQTRWGDKIITVHDDRINMQVRKSEVPSLIQQLAETKAPVYSITRKNSLEDYFLSLTSN